MASAVVIQGSSEKVPEAAVGKGLRKNKGALQGDETQAVGFMNILAQMLSTDGTSEGAKCLPMPMAFSLTDGAMGVDQDQADSSDSKEGQNLIAMAVQGLQKDFQGGEGLVISGSGVEMEALNPKALQSAIELLTAMKDKLSAANTSTVKDSVSATDTSQNAQMIDQVIQSLTIRLANLNNPAEDNGCEAVSSGVQQDHSKALQMTAAAKAAVETLQNKESVMPAKDQNDTDPSVAAPEAGNEKIDATFPKLLKADHDRKASARPESLAIAAQSTAAAENSAESTETRVMPQMTSSDKPSNNQSKIKTPVTGESNSLFKDNANNAEEKSEAITSNEHSMPKDIEAKVSSKESTAPLRQESAKTGEENKHTTIKIESSSVSQRSDQSTLAGVAVMTNTKIDDSGSVKAQAVIRQVVESVDTSFSNGSSRVKLELTPPNLGTLNMDLVVTQDRVKVIIVADNHDVSNLLQSNMDQLKSSLQQQGLKMDGIDVSVQDRFLGSQNGNSTGNWGGQQAWHHNGQTQDGTNYYGGASETGDAATSARMDSAEQTSDLKRDRNNMGLNLFV